MLRKPIATFLAAALLATGATTVTTTAAEAKAKPKAPAAVSAASAILYDATTKKTLWKRNANKRMPVGSMNKVMTALIVIRSGHLKSKITILPKYPQWVADNFASNAGLVAGERLSAYQLLHGMLLPSGCDAAYALADAYGGTGGYLGFLLKMNTLAKKLGMKNTHYASFDGVPAPDDYTTAADQLKLARYAMKSKTFAAIVKKTNYSVTTALKAHQWRNSDALLKGNGNSGYPGLYGIKTGSTGAAGGCFMFVARRAKHTLYGIVVKSTDKTARFYDTVNMLNWAYNTHTKVTITSPARLVND